MKIRIELDGCLEEDEIIIRCRELNESIAEIQRTVSDIGSKSQKFTFYKGDTEYYIQLEDVLFFETDESCISVHTRENMYQTRYKLYELEELLPTYFMRVSKSAILNVNQVFSISRNLSASSVVEFSNTHRTVYVSRHYYKPLKYKIEEKRVSR